ncbi:MAG: hypothetical protein D6770_09105 [Anaerolineae bacterium]|nr:MAG: hypothetical protein D6770_09105 [Anaerolineae bacterium]
MSEISAGTDAPLTDEEWAWAMAKEHIYAFAGGAEKIFYIGLYPAKSPEGTWLIYQEIEKSEEGGEKRVIIKNRQEKPAYYAYRTMVTVLEGFREAENLDPEAYLFRGEGIGEEDVRAMFDLTRHVLERGRYRFLLADGREIYVLWGEGDLPPELQGEVRVTDWRGETSTILAEDLRPDDAPLYVETLP